MQNWIRRALMRRRGRVEIAPSEKLVYGITFAIVSLIVLTALQIAHLIILQKWSTEIFAAVTLVIGTILGAFFGQRA